MPYGDRERQLEFLREYYAGYRVENAEEIAEKAAQWFRANQDHAQNRRRRNRALARARSAMRKGGVPVEYHGLVEAAVGIGAEYPDTPAEVLVKLLRAVPDREWLKFLTSLGRRDRARWEEIRP